MRPTWLRWTVAVVLLASLLAGGIALYQTADRPLVTQLVPVGVHMPPLTGSVIGWLDRNTVMLEDRDSSLYSVDMRTGHRKQLTALNRRIARLNGGIEGRSLSPDGQWLLIRGYHRKYASAWSALKIGGSQVVVWPEPRSASDRNQIIWEPSGACMIVEFPPSGKSWFDQSHTWLPDSSGVLQEVPVGNSRGLCLYRLRRPGVSTVIALSQDSSPRFLVGDAVPGKLFSVDTRGNEFRIAFFDPAHFGTPPDRTGFRLPGTHSIAWHHVDKPGKHILYGLKQERSLPPFMYYLSRWFPAAGIGFATAGREVWLADLKGRNARMISRDFSGLRYRLGLASRDYDAVPESIGWLPDGRPGFLYKGALYALPLPAAFGK